jgi:hypothetical protein
MPPKVSRRRETQIAAQNAQQMVASADMQK